MSSLPEPPYPQGRPHRDWSQALLTVLAAGAAAYLLANHRLHILDALPPAARPTAVRWGRGT